MNRTIVLDGKCDKTFFPLDLADNEEPYIVKYRDLTVPRPYGTISVTNALSSYRVQPNAQLFQVNEPNNLIPDSLSAAFWFTKSVYADTRRPVWYYFRPAKTIVCFPPVTSDGDRVIVGVETIPEIELEGTLLQEQTFNDVMLKLDGEPA